MAKPISPNQQHVAPTNKAEQDVMIDKVNNFLQNGHGKLMSTACFSGFDSKTVEHVISQFRSQGWNITKGSDRDGSYYEFHNKTT